MSQNTLLKKSFLDKITVILLTKTGVDTIILEDLFSQYKQHLPSLDDKEINQILFKIGFNFKKNEWLKFLLSDSVRDKSAYSLSCLSPNKALHDVKNHEDLDFFWLIIKNSHLFAEKNNKIYQKFILESVHAFIFQKEFYSIVKLEQLSHQVLIKSNINTLIKHEDVRNFLAFESPIDTQKKFHELILDNTIWIHKNFKKQFLTNNYFNDFLGRINICKKYLDLSQHNELLSSKGFSSPTRIKI